MMTLGDQVAWTDIVGVIASIITAAVAICGVTIAWKGLRTWRDQLEGHDQYDLAKRVALAAYRCRDAIRVVRNSFISQGEFRQAMDRRGGQTAAPHDEAAHFRQMQAVYEDRWARVVQERTNLGSELLEAQVLWGDELGQIVQRMDEIHREVFSAIHKYLLATDPKRKQEIDWEVMEKVEQVLWQGMAEPDELEKRYDEAIKRVEAFVRPHLRGKRRARD